MSTGDDFKLTHPVQVGARKSMDHYPTPRWCTLALLRFGRLSLPRELHALDPACGEGAIMSVVRQEFPGSNVWGIELHEGRAEDAGRDYQVVQGDGLEVDWGAPDLVIGNPPYSLATEFAWRAAQWAAEHGTVAALLLRLSFLEPANGRAVLFEKYRPDIHVLPRRPHFDGKDTDSTTSAWFVWPGTGQTAWLPP